MLLATARRRLLPAASLAALCLGVLIPAGAALGAGRSIALSGEGTGEKPQSKLWFNDGTWWAILHQTGKGLHFFEYAGTDWKLCTFMDAELGAGGAADVKWNGDELFVLAYSLNPELYAYTYDRRLRVFGLEPGFPVQIPIVGGSETMVLDQDSTGRLWATYEGDGGQVHVCWSTSPDHRQWFAPGLVIHTGIKDDDISTVVAFDHKIGVFWSDQNRWEFGFRVHRDGDSPDVWQPAELVENGSGCSDDHINVKADGDGNVYGVTKDLHNQFTLHVRDVRTGRWTNKGGVIAGTGTRAILFLCDADQTMYVPYTVWSGNALDICLRKASYASRTFTTVASAFLSGATMNNCTGTKQVLPHNCFMTMCEGSGHTWWNGWGTPPPDGPQPPAPPDSVSSEVLTRSLGSRSGGGGGQLVLDLRFDEGGGASTTDQSAAAHSVRLVAAPGKTALPGWTAGHRGAALHFDGLGSFAEVASSAALRIPGSFTLEAWLRWDGAAANGTLFAKGKSSRRNYQMSVRADGRIELKWAAAAGGTQTLTGIRAVPAASWHHVAGVYDMEAQRSRIYIDGRLDASTTCSGAPAVSDDPLLLGMRYSSSTPTEFLAGSLDDVHVWQGAQYQGDFDPEAPAQSHDQSLLRQSIRISWRPSEVTQPLTYHVYRVANGGPRVRLTPVATAQLAFTDEAPVSGRLCYEITAIDSLRREGRPSIPTCVDYATQGPPGTGDFRKAAPPAATLAMHAYPNPFNPSTELRLSLPEAGWVRLEIYDVAGRRVAKLQDGALPAGAHRFEWGAAAAVGSPLASGIYFARAEALGRTLHQKLILVK